MIKAIPLKTSHYVAAVLVALTFAIVPAMTLFADHNGAQVAHDEGQCGETTFTASIVDPEETHKVDNMYLVVHDGDDTYSENIPTDGSEVEITVGPFEENTTIKWRVFGGGERDYDDPAWNGYGSPGFASAIAIYTDEEHDGSYDWTTGGPDEENPFLNWHEIAVDGCEPPIEEEPKTSTLNVCKIIVDDEGNIINGDGVGAEFSIELTGPDFGETVTFNTPLTLDHDLVDDNGSAMDAQCQTYEVAAGEYKYEEEKIDDDDGATWGTILYHDFFNETPESVADFYELTEDGSANDNDNADGVINLGAEDERTLAIVNTLENLPPGEPSQCRITIISDETNTVVEKGGDNAKLLSFVHSGWTAVINSASWIWGDDPVADPEVEETQTFVKKFGWNGPVTSATLEVASDNAHSFDLNGAAGGDSAENNFQIGTQDSYDVSGAIEQGNNILSIAVTNTASEGSTAEQNPAGLLYKLTVTGSSEECDIAYEEAPETSTITVQKWNDENENGEWDEEESGMSGWEIVVKPESLTPVESFTVDSANEFGTTTLSALSSDKRYLVEVSGTYEYANGRVADAEYYSEDGWSTSSDWGADNPSEDQRTLDMIIDEAEMNWGSYNGGHLYKTVISGTDNQVAFRIFEREPSHYFDNVGSLTVNIYDITNNVVTTSPDGSTDVEVLLGEYQIVEILQTGWTQTAPEGPSYCHINTEGGESAVCSFGNTGGEILKEGHLVVTKIVVNNSGTATSTVEDFTLFAFNGNATTTLASGATTTLAVGNYTVSEEGPSGYEATFSGDCDADGNVDVAEGETAECRITNDDIHVEEPAEQCTLTITSDSTNTVVEKGGDNAKTLSFIHSTWTAVISGASWIWGDDPVVDPEVDETQTFIKTFTWNGPVGGATLEVASDNTHSFDLNGTTGGDSAENNYQIDTQDSYDVSGAIEQGNNLLSIAVTNLGREGHTVEQNPAGLLYKLTITSSSEECNVPHEEEGNLTVTKIVVNDSGTATSTVEDFTLFAFNGNATTTLASGATTTLAVGNYTVSEEGPSGYEATFSGDCDADGNVDVAEGETAECRITNDDIPAEEDESSESTGGSGGGGNSSGGGGSGGSSGGQVAGSSSTAPGGFSGNSNNGVVLGASTSGDDEGEVLGASSCKAIIYTHMRRGQGNAVTDVFALQEFLNKELGVNLITTGFYGPLTESAVNEFQLKYSDEVLAPWVSHGLLSAQTTTGYVYKTTKRWVNMVHCPALNIPMPQLP